jgi:HD superfamily phosphohydrolase
VRGAGIKIADAIHGTVQLTPLETQVIDSAVFQRMRGIRHLGLASLVFPGADYSRFSHGIGTSHVTGKILAGLEAAHPDKVDADDLRLYRIAALLHDVGHYPFSHTFEHALKDHYRSNALFDQGDEDQTTELELGMLLHEEVGSLVIRNDDQLASILGEAGLDLDEITRIITRSDEPPKFTNLVSSDLDADRIDYLLRTAAHTGLPYGHVDLDYLLTQIRLDDEGRICYTAKGMRAAEHLLLSRFFDYAQVSFHKTVAALELVLNEAVGVLLRRGKLLCTQTEIERMITEGDWWRFDDSVVLGLIRAAASDNELDDLEVRYCRAVIERVPPKMLFEWEEFGETATARVAKSLNKLSNSALADWESEFETKIWIWNRDISFTKIGSTRSIGDPGQDETYDKIKQAVLVLDEETGRGKPIQSVSRSLMPTLSNSQLHGFRIYALSVDMDVERLAALRARVVRELGQVI